MADRELDASPAGDASNPAARSPNSPSARRQAGILLVSAIVAGGCGYVVTVLASTRMPPEQYQRFGAYWSALYLIVAALSGIQQAVTRAVRPVAEESARPTTSVRALGLTCMVLTATIVAAFCAVFGDDLFGEGAIWTSVALVVGTTGYVAVATVGGLMFGLGLAHRAAAMSMIDGLVRLALFAVVIFLVSTGLPWLAMSVAVPFYVAVAAAWMLSRGQVTRRFHVDVPLKNLARQTWQTVLGATGSGIVLSGIPLFLGLIATDSSRATIGALTLLILLTRSPLVLPLLAVQGLLIERFRGPTAPRQRTLRRLLAVGAGVGVLAVVLGGLVLPPLIHTFISADFPVSGPVAAGLIASSVLVALMCITGPAAISADQHHAFSAGWIVTAVLSAGGLFLPWPSLEAGAVGSLICGPVVGLTIHLVALRRA